jgi:CheY-like chemotaxis protein
MVGNSHIFIIEDEPLIADELEEMVIALGYETGGIAYSLQPALAIIQNRGIQIDAAIVDISLRGELAYELCHALTDRGVPFAFATALTQEQIEAPWRLCPNIGKPFTTEIVGETLAKLLPDTHSFGREVSYGTRLHDKGEPHPPRR